MERRGKDLIPQRLTDEIDDLNPTDEPNPAPDESSGRGKARPDFFKPARWFGAKIVPPRMPHGMGECLGRPLV